MTKNEALKVLSELDKKATEASKLQIEIRVKLELLRELLERGVYDKK